MIDNGVDPISIGAPTATGEILESGMFEEYAVRYLNKLMAGIPSLKAPIIVHMWKHERKSFRFLPPRQSFCKMPGILTVEQKAILNIYEIYTKCIDNSNL